MKGSATVKRTNTAKWEGTRWRISVQKDGKRRNFYSPTPGRAGQREANAKADAWLDEGIDNTRRRVADVYDEFVGEIELKTSHSNYLKVKAFGDNWICKYVGHKRIEDMNENDLQLVIDRMHKQGLSKKHMTNLRATISQFCKFCRRIKVSTLNPEFLEIPKTAVVGKKNILQPEHLITLFSQNETIIRGKRKEDELIHAYRFAVATGLRPGELLGLEWKDIKKDIINVRRAINVYGETTSGKNENALRTFGLNAITREILEQQKAHSDYPFGKVFPITNERYLYSHWLRYCETNNIPHTTLYELRHTFVSVVKKLPEGQIKGLVGHSRNMDTYGVYSHDMCGEMEQTANAVSDTFETILNSVLKSVLKA